MLESFLNNVSGLQARKFINKRIQHRRFPVNIAKFLKTSFLKEHLWGLLLYFGQFKYQILTSLWRNCILRATSILPTLSGKERQEARVFAVTVITTFLNLLLEIYFRKIAVFA